MSDRKRPDRPAERRTRRPSTTPAAPSLGELRVVALAATRKLTWTLPAVAREVRAWRSLAARIPDDALRHDALSALTEKRGHIDGAALFCVFTAKPNMNLLRLLVAYEVMWDFLDTVNEHGAERGTINGRQLHLALIDALNPEPTNTDYYRHHPWREDGGYLKILVRTCREECSRLPSFESVRPLLAREAWRAQVLALNHDLDPTRRDRQLRRWAQQELLPSQENSWYELTGAASASLTIHALFALAAKNHIGAADIDRVCRAYSPSISAATTMLDSYADQAEDACNGDHSYIAHYPSPETALRRIGDLLRRSTTEARTLIDGERHALIVAAMTAMYLSKDSARVPEIRVQTRALVRAAGPLARPLLPILRLWRVLCAQRSN